MAEGLKWRVNNAVTRSTLPPHARLVMFVLSNRADTRTAVIPDEHTPSLSDLADESGLGLATVKRHLNILEADGWVQRDRPTDEERVRGVRTRYRLAIGTTPCTAQPEPSDHGSERAVPRLTVSLGTAQAEPRHGSEWAQSTAQSEPSTYIPIVSDLKELTTGAADAAGESDGALFPVAGSKSPAEPKRDPAERFSEFYKTYPRKKARARAEAAWIKVVKAGAEPQVVIEAADRFAAWCERTRQDPNFVPDPATWLNDHSWDDEEDPARSQQRPGQHTPYREDPDDDRPYAGEL